MRLAQLARKLTIRPTAIVEYLIEHNIQIDDGSNTRLEHTHIALIMQKFAPAKAAEVAAELAIEKETEEALVLEEPAAIVAPQNIPESNTFSDSAEKIEVIRPQKIELTGLKVLGKIELPELKKKEAEALLNQTQQQEESVLAEPEKKPPQENRKPYPSRKETGTQRPLKNPIALQREREALQAEKRKRAQAEREKEKRTQHYLKKVKVASPTKSLKLVKEEVEEMEPLAPVPKTWWGKFMKWLNT
jgi:hypothetical protein